MSTPAQVDAPPSPAIDAPRGGPDGQLDYDHCDSPAGTAVLTAAHQDLQPQYARMYAGGLFTGGGDSGGPPGFELRPYFTNDSLPTPAAVINCSGGSDCATVGIVVAVDFDPGNELGVHPAQLRDSASTWQATGTVTLTDFVYPEQAVGHVAGSIHVDSTTPLVTIDGTFDHAFCVGLVAAVL